MSGILDPTATSAAMAPVSPDAAWIAALGKLPFSLFNGIVAVIFAPILGVALHKALKAAHLEEKLGLPQKSGSFQSGIIILSGRKPDNLYPPSLFSQKHERPPGVPAAFTHHLPQ